MSDVVDLSVGLLRKFAEFTRKLTPEQLTALVAGELKFGLLDTPPPKRTRSPSPSVDASAVAAELAALTSREAAAAHVDSLGLTVAKLKDLAKALGASLVGASGKGAIRDRIVEHTVGFRLNSQTIRHGSWSTERDVDRETPSA
jgi:hypothetical protein